MAVAAMNFLFAVLCGLSGDRQGAFAFLIITNIWLVGHAYGSKRDSVQAGGEK